MSHDLLTKATALLEAREKLPHAEPFGGVEIQEDFPRFGQPRGSKIYDDTSKYLELAANTAPEIITGYQQLLKEKDDIIQTLEDENEMLVDSNEHLTHCAAEKHELLDLVRRMAEALEESDRVLAALPSLKAVIFTETELDMMRRVACLKKQVLEEAHAAMPQHQTTTTL